MTSILMQQILGRARRLPATLARPTRLALALGALVTVLAPTMQPPVSAGQRFVAESRLQLVVKEVKIYDDRDGAFAGQGEMEMHVSIGRCPVELPSPCLFQTVQLGPQAHAKFPIRANTGDIVTLDRVVPQEGDETSGGASPEYGFSTWFDHNTVVRFDMAEYDAVSNPENMGWIAHVLEAGKNDQHLGTFTLRSVKDQGARVGDYSVTFAIRRVLLPDLKAIAMRVEAVPGSPKQRLCATAQNDGPESAGPFSIDFYLDGIRPPFWVAEAQGLGASRNFDYCIEVDALSAGPHEIGAEVDSRGKVVEFNEANNRYDTAYTAPQPAAPSKPPTPGQGAAQPDLVVSAIKVNGQVPDGKDDCKDGKNVAAVTVKNEGAAQVQGVAVRLTVDGVNVASRSVARLEAGDEREVRFENVQLKQGEHTLAATADLKDPVADTTQDDHELKIVARCQAGV